MNIAYSCNDFYIPQTGISIISLCENNKKTEDICIYFIGKDVSPANVAVLRTITESFGRRFIFIDFDTIAHDLNISSIGRHIETIYAKVFFTRIEGLDKIIYLDSDTIVDGSLEPLWNDDLRNVYMGAVQTFSKMKGQLGMPENAPFFNDGMAIVNVEYCRKHNLTEKVLKVIAEYDGNPPTLSEGALNKVCLGHVKYISLRWNCMAGILYFGKLDMEYLSSRLDQYTKEDLEESCNHPVVIHYLTAFYNRPWFSPCTHPYKDRYYHYQAMSPWKDIKPTKKPLPLKLKLIDLCFRFLGVKVCTKLRRVK